MKAIEVFKTAVKSLSIRVCLFIFSVLMLYHTVFAIAGSAEPIDVVLYIVIVPLSFLWCFRYVKYKVYIIGTILLSGLALISYFSSQLYTAILPILISLIVLWLSSIKGTDFSPIKKILFVVSNLMVVCVVYIFQLGYNPIATSEYEIYEPLRLQNAWKSIIVKTDKKYGVVDAMSGEELLPLCFDSIEQNDLSISLSPKEEEYIKSIGVDQLGVVSYKKNKLYVYYPFVKLIDANLQKREIECYISEQYDSIDLEIRKQFRQLNLNWIKKLVNKVTGGDTIFYKNKCDLALASLGTLLLKSDSLVVNNIRVKVMAFMDIDRRVDSIFSQKQDSLMKEGKILTDEKNDSIRSGIKASLYVSFLNSFSDRDMTELKHSIIQTIIYLRLKECLTSNCVNGHLNSLFNICNQIVAYSSNVCKYGNISSSVNFNIQVNDSIAKYSENVCTKLRSYDVVNRINNKYNDFFYVSTALYMPEDYLQNIINNVKSISEIHIKKADMFVAKSKNRRSSLNGLSTEESIAMSQGAMSIIDDIKTNLNTPFSEKPSSELEKFLFEDVFILLEMMLKEYGLISYHSDAIIVYERLTICGFTRNMEVENSLKFIDDYYSGRFSKTQKLRGIITEANNVYDDLCQKICKMAN